jgi:hypothetical protein
VVAAWHTHDSRGIGLKEVPTMEREHVTSTSIASVGYDIDAETLEAEFVGSDIYQYYGVPQEVHEELMRADSVGTFFNAHVRNNYSYARL